MTTPSPKFARGEIWWVDFNPSIGSEMQKVRPAAVLSTDATGILKLRLVVPLTTWQPKFQGKPWLVRVEKTSENGLQSDCAGDVFQLKSVSTERFGDRVGRLNADRLSELAAAVAMIVGYLPRAG